MSNPAVFDCPVDGCTAQSFTPEGMKRHVEHWHPDADWNYRSWLDENEYEPSGVDAFAEVLDDES